MASNNVYGRQPAQWDPSLRRLLRNLRTGAYFADGRWTLEAREAQTFPSTAEAIRVAIHRSLEDVEVVLQFGPEPSTAYDYHLALEFSHSGRAAPVSA